MGADRWSECPKCLVEGNARRASAEEKVKLAEGMNDLAQYRAAMKLLDRAKSYKSGENFREDYEIGVTPAGEFYVTYNGKCQICSFSHEFRLDKNLLNE